jgi:hypothetical protein
MQADRAILTGEGRDSFRQPSRTAFRSQNAPTNADADARIILEAVTTTVRQSTSTESSSLVWQRLTDRGSVTETAMALPSFVGGVAFSAPGGLSVQVPQSADLKTQIAALSAQPGMGYLGDLAARSDVNWQQVKLAHESWDHTREGLTPAGAALLSVAVAWATAGTGAEWVGGTVTTSSAAEKTPASCASVVGPKRLPRGLDEFDVFAQQVIHELADLDAAGLGAGREVGLHLRVEVDRQMRRRVRLEELATDALGEVDLGGHVVVMRLGLRSHGVHLSLRPQVAAVIVGHRGSFSYCRRSPRVASRAEMILTLAVSDPVAV